MGVPLCHLLSHLCFALFRTKLNYNPPKEDGSVYRIELQGVSMDTMKQILEYIFSGEVRADPIYFNKFV